MRRFATFILAVPFFIVAYYVAKFFNYGSYTLPFLIALFLLLYLPKYRLLSLAVLSFMTYAFLVHPLWLMRLSEFGASLETGSENPRFWSLVLALVFSLLICFAASRIRFLSNHPYFSVLLIFVVCLAGLSIGFEDFNKTLAISLVFLSFMAMPLVLSIRSKGDTIWEKIIFLLPLYGLRTPMYVSTREMMEGFVSPTDWSNYKARLTDTLKLLPSVLFSWLALQTIDHLVFSRTFPNTIWKGIIPSLYLHYPAHSTTAIDVARHFVWPYNWIIAISGGMEFILRVTLQFNLAAVLLLLIGFKAQSNLTSPWRSASLHEFFFRTNRAFARLVLTLFYKPIFRSIKVKNPNLKRAVCLFLTIFLGASSFHFYAIFCHQGPVTLIKLIELWSHFVPYHFVLGLAISLSAYFETRASQHLVIHSLRVVGYFVLFSVIRTLGWSMFSATASQHNSALFFSLFGF